MQALRAEREKAKAETEMAEKHTAESTVLAKQPELPVLPNTVPKDSIVHPTDAFVQAVPTQSSPGQDYQAPYPNLGPNNEGDTEPKTELPPNQEALPAFSSNLAAPTELMSNQAAPRSGAKLAPLNHTPSRAIV